MIQISNKHSEQNCKITDC